LKPEYRMPSFKDMPETDRRVLARYLASLKVEDWYLDEALGDRGRGFGARLPGGFSW